MTVVAAQNRQPDHHGSFVFWRVHAQGRCDAAVRGGLPANAEKPATESHWNIKRDNGIADSSMKINFRSLYNVIHR